MQSRRARDMTWVLKSMNERGLEIRPGSPVNLTPLKSHRYVKSSANPHRIKSLAKTGGGGVNPNGQNLT
jgi:hypothetical protein